MPLSDGTARSRRELVCPSCRTEGLDRFDAFAQRHDNPRDKLIHGTRCPNCEQRVPPEKVKEQLAPPEWSLAGLSITIPSFIRNPPTRAIAYTTGVLVFILAFVVVPTMIGPVLGGGSAQTDAPRGGTEVYADGGWTIYETSSGDYYIYNGNQYLTPTGPSSTPYYYNTEGVARDVLDSYHEYDSSGSFEFGESNNSTGDYPGWSANNTSTSTNETDGPSWTYNGTTGDGSGNTEYQTPSSGDGTTDPGYQDPNDGTSQPDDGYTAPTDKEPLHGHVRDSQGQPIADATVTVSGTDVSVTTGDAGEYALISHLPTGTHEISVSRDGLTTRPITIEKSYNGDITVQGSPDHAVYVEGSDGTVAQNKLSIIMPDSGVGNPITLSGTGSDMTGTIRFQSLANAKSASITLTGIQSSDHRTVSVTPDTPRFIGIDGNTAPNAVINLTSTPVTETQTEQGSTSSTAAFELKGNQPTTPTITLKPNPQTTIGQQSGTLTATEGQTRLSVTNDGNIDVPVDVTLNGREWTVSENQQGTLDDESTTVSVDGYTGSRNPTLTLTGQSSISDSLASGREHNSNGGQTDYVWGESNDQYPYVQQTEVFTPEEPGIYRVSYSLQANYYSHVHNSWGDSTFPEFGRAQVRFNGESLDSVYAKCPKYTGCSDTDQNSSTTTVQVTEQMVENHATFIAQATAKGKRPDGDGDYHSTATAEIESIKRVEKTGEVTVRQDGQYVDTTQSLRDGETTTVALDDLPAGTSTLELTTSGSKPVDYELAWTERHRTSGATIQKNGQTVASIDEGFTGTRTLEIPASAVPPGESEFVFTGPRQADRYDVALEWTSKTVTKQPTVKTSSGRVLYSESGRLESTQTVEVDEPIPAGETVTVTRGDGTLDYELSYPATVVADSPTVSVNDETYAYPSAFNASGSRLTESVSLNSSALTLGQNELRVSADPVDGIQPDVTATVSYKGSLVITNEPTVTVTNGDGESHTAEVPASQLQDGRLMGNASLNLPGEWFTTGKNTVRVRTADGSVVEAKLTARGIYQQEREFTEG